MRNPPLFKLLILEDDLEALSTLLAALFRLEAAFAPYDFDVTVLTTYEEVERLINPQASEAYDVILLDRDCKKGGSFHVLDIEKFGPDRIISISSTPVWNAEAESRGVTHIVPKTFSDLTGFANNVAAEVAVILEEKLQ